MLKLVWAYGTDTPLFADAAAVRVHVFVEEQGYDPLLDIDEQDANSWHVVGYEDGKPVCTARLFTEPTGEHHIGRVAVLAACRGKKYGAALLNAMVQKAQDEAGTAIILNSQQDKTGFYKSVGFAETGQANLDEGQPHMWMRLVL